MNAEETIHAFIQQINENFFACQDCWTDWEPSMMA